MGGGLISGLAGGALIGLAASWLWLGTGRIAGISGLLREALFATGDRRVPVAFIVGLVVAGLLGSFHEAAPPLYRSLPAVMVGGALVGAGTAWSNGCTSGHGVCGLSRMSPRALVATLVFMTTGALTVWVRRTHGGGG